MRCPDINLIAGVTGIRHRIRFGLIVSTGLTIMVGMHHFARRITLVEHDIRLGDFVSRIPIHHVPEFGVVVVPVRSTVA